MDTDILGFILNKTRKFDKIITEYNKYPYFSKNMQK